VGSLILLTPLFFSACQHVPTPAVAIPSGGGLKNYVLVYSLPDKCDSCYLTAEWAWGSLASNHDFIIQGRKLDVAAQPHTL